MSIQNVPGSVLRTGDAEVNTAVKIPEGPKAAVCVRV